MKIRWYAGAAAAAGVTEEEIAEVPTAAVRDALGTLHPSARTVLARCTFLADGARIGLDEVLPAHTMLLDVLPPFAGG